MGLLDLPVLELILAFLRPADVVTLASCSRTSRDRVCEALPRLKMTAGALLQRGHRTAWISRPRVSYLHGSGGPGQADAITATSSLILRARRSAVAVELDAWRRPVPGATLSSRIPRLWSTRLDAPRGRVGFEAPLAAHAGGDAGVAVVFSSVVHVYRWRDRECASGSHTQSAWSPARICRVGDEGTWRWRPRWCRLSDPDLIVACDDGAVVALFDSYTGRCTGRFVLSPPVDLASSACSFDAVHRVLLVADASSVVLFALDDDVDEDDSGTLAVAGADNAPRVRRILGTRLPPAWRAPLEGDASLCAREPAADASAPPPRTAALLCSAADALPPMRACSLPHAGRLAALYPDTPSWGRATTTDADVLVLRGRTVEGYVSAERFVAAPGAAATPAVQAAARVTATATAAAAAAAAAAVEAADAASAFCATGSVAFYTAQRDGLALRVAGRLRRKSRLGGPRVSAAAGSERRYVTLGSTAALAESAPWGAPLLRLMPECPEAEGAARAGIFAATREGVFYVAPHY